MHKALRYYANLREPSFQALDKALLDTWDSYTLDPAVTGDQEAGARSGVAGGLYTITGLGEATVYRVKIGARNEFGWSYADEEFVFGTKGAGEKQHYYSYHRF